MCGIAGIWAKSDPNILQIESSLKLLCHRGPDDQKYETFKTKNGLNATLLFTRLAIIDLDPRANQPMGYGGLWLTLNGEIYNYREIRKELEEKGVQFHTSSDTEVLLKGLYTYGWSILNKLEGMWAIAVYDENNDRLTLCRDRFGEKPLSYIKTTDGIFYASEVKILEKLSGTILVPNKLQLQRFLINGYKSLYKTTETFFEGVIDVPAKSLLHFNDDGSIDTEVYWKPNIEIDESIDFSEAVKQSREKLVRSLDLRMRADVPLAFSLSGGVDSVSLVSLAKRELNVPVHGFTIRNSDPRYEEWELVDKVVNELKIEHTYVDLSTIGFLENLRAMISHRNTPVLTITYYVQWLLMKTISQKGFRVVIGGAGADELYTGYYDHHLFYIASLNGKPRENAIELWRLNLMRFIQNPFLSNPNLFIEEPNFRDHIYLDSNLYKTFLNSKFSENFSEKKYHVDPLKNRMLNELFEEIIPVIMHEEDLNAMNFSIENRSPYLDRELFETTVKFPTRLMVNNGRAKAILRESVRGIAPDIVIDNARKIGFNAPIESLLDLNDLNTKKEILSDSPIFEIVNREYVSSFLEKRNLTNSESKFLFSFLSAKLFLET
jgi:asparagine synthase (glutamine-hydrolysing)